MFVSTLFFHCVQTVSPGTWEFTMFFMRNFGQELDLVNVHVSVTGQN